jgi:hypothetical protein
VAVISDADALLAEAFAGRYAYPEGFAGFTARARFGLEGAGVASTVALCGAGDVEAVPDFDDADDDENLLQELRSLSRLLWPHDYQRGEGRFDKSLAEDSHPLGVLVTLHDDPHQATFRVRGGRIAQMTRRHGDLVEVVRIERWHSRPDGRVIPARFSVEFWDEGRADPLRVDRYWDLYRPLAGEIVPLVRRVEHRTDDFTITRVLTLRSWQLATRSQFTR